MDGLKSFPLSSSTSITNVANGLILDSFFEELTSAGSQTFAAIDFDSKYYEVNDIKQSSLADLSYQYKALHMNTQSLPSKFAQLKLLLCNLADTDKFRDFILLCETFLSEKNSHLYQLQG